MPVWSRRLIAFQAAVNIFFEFIVRELTSQSRVHALFQRLIEHPFIIHEAHVSYYVASLSKVRDLPASLAESFQLSLCFACLVASFFVPGAYDQWRAAQTLLVSTPSVWGEALLLKV